MLKTDHRERAQVHFVSIQASHGEVRSDSAVPAAPALRGPAGSVEKRGDMVVCAAPARALVRPPAAGPRTWWVPVRRACSAQVGPERGRVACTLR